MNVTEMSCLNSINMCETPEKFTEAIRSFRTAHLIVFVMYYRCLYYLELVQI